MTKTFSDLMREARSLVSNQRLDEATATITQALSGAKTRRESGPAAHAGPTIDLEAEARRTAQPAPSLTSTLAAKLAPILATRPRFTPPKLGQASPPGMPEGARFETHAYAAPAGGRAYKLYVPAALPAGPRPLLVMLHGCTQNPDDFARGTRMNALAEEAGILVCYPEQPQAANAQRCWNWFDPSHQHRDGGEPAILAGIVREIVSAHPIDASRVFVAGLSAGGAMAAVLGATYPELFAGIGVHSGLPYGAATDVGSALAVMRSGTGRRAAQACGKTPRLIVIHGEGDRTVHPGNGEAVAGSVPAGPGKDIVKPGSAGGRAYRRLTRPGEAGGCALEYWKIEGLGHAWSGGDAGGSHSDPEGPDASREMLRFFLEGEGRR